VEFILDKNNLIVSNFLKSRNHFNISSDFKGYQIFVRNDLDYPKIYFVFGSLKENSDPKEKIKFNDKIFEVSSSGITNIQLDLDPDDANKMTPVFNAGFAQTKDILYITGGIKPDDSINGHIYVLKYNIDSNSF